MIRQRNPFRRYDGDTWVERDAKISGYRPMAVILDDLWDPVDLKAIEERNRQAFMIQAFERNPRLACLHKITLAARQLLGEPNLKPLFGDLHVQAKPQGNIP